MSPTPKKLRSQPPDVVVAVGSGEDMQEFECYRVVLSLASDYFDVMLSAGMKENETSRIELPGKKPDEWQMVYKFIDPGLIRDAKVDESNVMTLLPLFHEFQMIKLVEECDRFLDKTYIFSVLDRKRSETAFDEDFWLNEGPSNHTTDIKRKTRFRKMMDLLKAAFTFDLELTIDAAGNFLCSLLEDLEFTHDLFDLSTVKELVQLILPLETDGSGTMHSFGKLSFLWDALEEVLSPLMTFLSPETINGNELFPLLLHTQIQQHAKDFKASSLRSTVQQEKFALRRSAKFAIDTLTSMLPNKLESINSASSVALKKYIYKLSANELKAEFEMFKTSVPESYKGKTNR